MFKGYISVTTAFIYFFFVCARLKNESTHQNTENYMLHAENICRNKRHNVIVANSKIYSGPIFQSFNIVKPLDHFSQKGLKIKALEFN